MIIKSNKFHLQDKIWTSLSSLINAITVLNIGSGQLQVKNDCFKTFNFINYLTYNN